MQYFKLTADKYHALLTFQAQIWSGYPEMSRNPRVFIVDDARWQIRH